MTVGVDRKNTYSDRLDDRSYLPSSARMGAKTRHPKTQRLLNAPHLQDACGSRSELANRIMCNAPKMWPLIRVALALTPEVIASAPGPQALRSSRVLSWARFSCVRVYVCVCDERDLSERQTHRS